MSRSLGSVAAGATLNFLKACNIPYVKPLIDVALHIYTTVDALKANRRDAVELAKCVGNTVRKIAERHSGESYTPMQQGDINELLETLQGTDNSLMIILKRPRFYRWIYYKDDQEELRKQKESYSSAKLEYLFSNKLSKIAQKRAETYAIYTLKDIESLRVVKIGPVREEAGRIVQCGEVKSVLIRRYTEQSVKDFLSDIEFYSKLTHPNFLFIGASSTSSSSPFMIFENGNYQHAFTFFDQIRDHGSVEELIKHAVIMIPDILAAFDYCKHIKFESFDTDTVKELIKYNGHKVILDLEPSPTKTTLPTVSLVAQKLFVDTDGRLYSTRFAYPPIFLRILQERSAPEALLEEGMLRFIRVEILLALMIPPTNNVLTSFLPNTGPLWPFWWYLHASNADRTVFTVTQKIRDAALHTGSFATSLTPHIAHSLILDYGNAPYFSVPWYVGDIEVELGDVGYFDPSFTVFIKITNILPELRAQSIVGSDIVISGPTTCGCHYCSRGRTPHTEGYWYTLFPIPNSKYFHSKIKFSIHDTCDEAARRKVQKYFHDGLLDILAQQSNWSSLVNQHFALVVEIDDGHDIYIDAPNEKGKLRPTESLSDIDQYEMLAHERTKKLRKLRAAHSTSDLSSTVAHRKYWVRYAVTEYVPD